MKREEIVEKLDLLLSGMGIQSRKVDLGRSTVLGVGNKILFDVIDEGFMVQVLSIKELETRPEVSIVMDNFLPAGNKLFVNIKKGEDDLLHFWVNESLGVLK